MEITIKLKDILKEKNITQKELAEMTGLREATISELANNSRNAINKDHLILIMKALNITDLNRIINLTWT